ncbi:MAG: ATP-binding cassette domain-containing protein [Thiotrichales bacterium]|nr:ATP-binding cassette domain-containing protein [Thiotrichales bacterium]
MKTLACRNLGVQRGAALLLDGVNADFLPERISVILGQNGAGKSTLLQALAKNQALSAGEILWHGQPLVQWSWSDLAKMRALVEQQTPLPFAFSVRQLVSLGLEVQRAEMGPSGPLLPAAFQGYLQEILRVCDLLALSERSVLTLSGGELKRAHLARALAQIWPLDASGQFHGKWLLLDEWNVALDVHHQQCFAVLLRQWCAQGLGVIMVLHDLPLAMQLADEVLLLKQGRVLAQGTAAEIWQPLLLQEALQTRLEAFTHADGSTLFLPKL